jgi:Pyruvate/2-oxoacid:ferredoxin oxidoreductase delta subunit
MTQSLSAFNKPLSRTAVRNSNSDFPTRSPIKKIPIELRKPVPAHKRESRPLHRLAKRLREDSQYLRGTIQLAFVLLCIWIGIEFHFFMKWGLAGGQGAIAARPPGVEGFLPISALITLKYWLQTGLISMIHPAALFILVAIIAVSLAVKKAFCSWLCPVGTLSESLWMLGRKLTGRTFVAPRWLDYPLRSLKYLLLLFFGYSIWNMDVEALRNFIYSPYNKVADIKMYLFFAEISTFALGVVAALMLLSVFIQNFWCRFLCPYGALLGIAGWLSPLKITRTASTCIDCELCTKACPASINVHTAGKVWSDECTGCLACVQVCPVRETLELRAGKRAPAVPSWVVGSLVAGVFVAITGLAMLAGTWQNSISAEEYQKRFGQLNEPIYQHFRGEVPAYGPQD